MVLKTPVRPSWQDTELDKPLVTASYFGFTPIATPRITEEDIKAAVHCDALPHFDAVEKAALIRAYMEANMAELPHPLALIHRRAVKKRGEDAGYTLHYIGAAGGLAEAALIRAALSILSDEGHKSLRVDLNCVGDKDSLAAYERELGNFLRKANLAPLSEEMREALKADVFNLFRREEEALLELRGRAPSAVSFLSSQARNHFKEVLEFVESLGVEFGLEPSLIGEKHHSSHTVFGIRRSGLEAERAEGGDEFLAVGYRYSRLGKRLGLRKEVPMASVSVFTGKNKKESARKLYKELPRPKFYLVQLGREAKMRTLSLLEDLRREHVSVHHFLGKDKLGIQLQGAEEHRVPYLIIIGHKEALDGTATVRNIQTRAQDTISLSLLPQYLKKISL